jgi:hypothetical protein
MSYPTTPKTLLLTDWPALAVLTAAGAIFVVIGGAALNKLWLNESNDQAERLEQYTKLRADVTVASEESAIAAQIAVYYEAWLDQIIQRPVWRLVGPIALLIGVLVGTLVYFNNSAVYRTPPTATTATLLVFPCISALLTAALVFSSCSGLITWLGWHSTRPAGNFNASRALLTPLHKS